MTPMDGAAAHDDGRQLMLLHDDYPEIDALKAKRKKLRKSGNFQAARRVDRDITSTRTQQLRDELAKRQAKKAKA